MALVAYGYYLEHEGRLEEALEALQLGARTYRDEFPPLDLATLSLLRWPAQPGARAVAHALTRHMELPRGPGSRCRISVR